MRGISLSSVFLALMLLCGGSVIAQFNPDWYGYQHDVFLNAQTGFFTSDWTNESVSPYNLSVGSTIQPLSVDWFDGAAPELILFDEPYLFVYNFSVSEGLTLARQRNLLNGLDAAPTMYQYPSTEWSWIGIVNMTFLAYGKTETGFALSYPATPLQGCEEMSGVACGVTECYMLCQNYTRGNLTVFQFDMINNVTTTSNISNTKLPVSALNSGFHTMAIGDIDNDFADELVFACDKNNDDSYGVCVIDTSTLNYDTYFSGDGVLDGLTRTALLSTAVWTIQTPMLIQADAAGDLEIILTYAAQGTCNALSTWVPKIHALRATGTDYWTSTFRDVNNVFMGCGQAGSTTMHTSGSTLTTIDGIEYICMSQSFGITSGSLKNRSDGCVRATTGVISFQHNFSGAVASLNSLGSFSFPETGGSTLLELGPLLYRPNIQTGGLDIVQNFGDLLRSYSWMGQDFDGDQNIDIVATQNDTAHLFTQFIAGTGNAMPELNATLSHSGYTGYSIGPTCKGSNVTFRARECPNGLSFCNFNNDEITDTETLTTTCGSGSEQTGTLSFNNPGVTCFFNTTGTFQIIISLTDQAHTGNTSESNQDDPILINVIDGIPGTTCNTDVVIVPVVVTPELVAGTDLAASFDSLWNFMFGFSTVGARAKVFFSFGLILIIIIGGLTLIPTHNSSMTAWILAVFGVVVTWGIGLLATWIMIITMVGLLLIVFMKHSTPSGNTGV